MMRKQTKEYALIFVWFLLVVAACYPLVVENSALYRMVKIAIFLIMLLLSWTVSITHAIKSRFLQRVAGIVALVFVTVLSLSAFSLNVRWTDASALLIVFWVMCIGRCFSIDGNGLRRIVLLYGIITIVLGALTLVYYTGTISIDTYEYAVENKNVVGQVVATGAVGTLILYENTDERYRLIYLSLLVVSVIILTILRCRTAILAFLLVGVYYVQRRTKLNKRVLLLYALITILFFFSSTILSLFDSVFVGSHEIDDLDSLSANRLGRNIDGLLYFYINPVWGELKGDSGIANIHNYVIKRLVQYGLFSLPLIVFYLGFAIRLLKQWWRPKGYELSHVGLFMLFIPFFSSLLEPSAPFGPGLVQCIPFFMYGVYLRNIEAR